MVDENKMMAADGCRSGTLSFRVSNLMSERPASVGCSIEQVFAEVDIFAVDGVFSAEAVGTALNVGSSVKVFDGSVTDGSRRLAKITKNIISDK